MRGIGGYFELELPQSLELHSKAIALNSGRFCLEYILLCRKYSKVYVPYFTCDSVIEPILKLNISYVFYHIDENYCIVDDINLADGEALLYTNYWGLNSQYCYELSLRYGKQLILDYTQAFYADPIKGIDTFYSCRKYFGVPDGGYVYTDAIPDFKLDQDISYDRFFFLLKRIDLSAEEGYADFRKSSELFHDFPIRYMSKLTRRIMQSIDYQEIAIQRRNNYEYLRNALGGQPLSDSDVPMIFPYQSSNGVELRRHLIQNRVFVAKYWPNVDSWAGHDALETKMSNNILPLPIDQRYGFEEMDYIINLISI